MGVGCSLCDGIYHIVKEIKQNKKAGKEITQHSSFHSVTVFQMSRNIRKYLFIQTKKENNDDTFVSEKSCGA